MGLVAYDLGMERAAGARVLRALVDLGFPCNLACAGCARRRSPPPDAVALEDLAENLARAVEESEPARAAVVFYGGEPLLDVEGVAQASAAIRAACRRLGAAYDATVITNGTLLDERAALALAAAGVLKVQVTLAGPPPMHDGRRPLGGAGSFHRILRNLRGARQHLAVLVRCDVAEGCGLGAVADLVRLLEAEGFFEEPHPATILLGRPGSYASQARAILAFTGPAASPGLPGPGPEAVPPAG
jgi:sulfatase maturation enzyme AslB (radical SAM superfamily)